MTENPFTLGNIMPGGPFCNRRAEIDELCRYANNGDKVVICSARQIGVTSLVRRVAARLEKERFLPVYVQKEVSLSAYGPAFRKMVHTKPFRQHKMIRRFK